MSVSRVKCRVPPLTAMASSSSISWGMGSFMPDMIISPSSVTSARAPPVAAMSTSLRSPRYSNRSMVMFLPFSSWTVTILYLVLLP